MFTVNGQALPSPHLVRNTVPVTRIPVRQGDGFKEVHQRFVELRAREFQVDAKAFDIRVETSPDPVDPTKRRYAVTHHFADGGPRHLIHEDRIGPQNLIPGRKAAITSNLRSAFDIRMWRLRHEQSRLNAIAAMRMSEGSSPAWSIVADEIVQGMLSASGLDMDEILHALGAKPFATRDLPVKRRRVADPNRERHALLSNGQVASALAPMRGSLSGGTLQIDRMELGRGALYDGHPSGAQISVPLDRDLPDTLMLGLIGNPIGNLVEHSLLPKHLKITAVRRTTHMLQLTVHAPKMPMRTPPVGIDYDISLR